MPEVPHAGEEHRHAMFIGRGDDLGILNRTPGLNDRGRPGLRRFIYAVAKRIED